MSIYDEHSTSWRAGSHHWTYVSPIRRILTERRPPIIDAFNHWFRRVRQKCMTRGVRVKTHEEFASKHIPCRHGRSFRTFLNWSLILGSSLSFPQLKKYVGYHTLTNFCVCEFSKIAHWNSEKWVWDDAGGGCNVAVPSLPPDVLADGPRASQYLPAQPTSRRGRLGTATLQPPPASSYTHFSDFQWAIFENSSVPHTNFFVHVRYPTFTVSHSLIV